jgi:hypothetical protein
MGARAEVMKAIFLGALAFGVFNVRSEVRVHADEECQVGDCYMWYGCEGCEGGGPMMCGYVCWSCDNGDYGCA